MLVRINKQTVHKNVVLLAVDHPKEGKLILDPMVQRLRRSGVEDTPYRDRNW